MVLPILLPEFAPAIREAPCPCEEQTDATHNMCQKLFVGKMLGTQDCEVTCKSRRNAEACSADSVSTKTGALLYSFKDRQGEYYGGEAFPFALVRSPKLARIVFYRAAKPQVNKIAMGCLFHRLVIVGRGLTDLDEATVVTHSAKAQPASQPI